MPARTIGCANVSGRPGSRISAAASRSAADAACSSSSSASRAACCRSPRSRIDTARARRPACEGSRSSRRTIERPTVRAPIRSTCAADDAVGSTCSSRSAATSSRIRNGVPPVAWRQASVNARSGARPSPASRKSAIATLVSGARRSTSAAGSVVRVASSPASAPDSRGLAPSNTVTPSPSSRGSRNVRNRNDGESAQCASSTAMHTGPAAARLAHSQYRPWSTANGGSGPTATAPASELAPGSPSSSAATPAAPCSRSARSAGRAVASGTSSSWRATPNANSRSSWAPRARSSRIPRAWATASAALSIAVLPIPAGPSITSIPPLPSRPRARTDSISSSCSPRSSSSGPMLGGRSGRGAPAGDSGRSGSDIRSARRRRARLHGGGRRRRRLACSQDRAERADPVGMGRHQPGQDEDSRAQPPHRDPRRPGVRRGPWRLERLVDRVSADRDRAQRQQRVEHDVERRVARIASARRRSSRRPRSGCRPPGSGTWPWWP